MDAIDLIIEKQFYIGILDQDGWETLFLTVHDNHTKERAEAILARIKEQTQGE